MIYTQDGTIWVECDKCTFTMFGGFKGDGKMDVINPLIRFGWTFTDRALCPECAKEEQRCKALEHLRIG